MKNASKFLFYAGFAICLSQIWLPAFYLTCDGPCHVYNAQILHDLIIHKDTDFYNKFYSISLKANPNWSSHIIIACLMFAVNGVIAEKILLTAYVLLFVTGFSILLKRMAGGNKYLQLLPFLFVFNYIIVKGFYNFSLSIAILFWMVELWLRYLDAGKIKTIVIFFLLTQVLFFTHPFAFAFGGFSCFALTLTGSLARILKSLKDRLKVLVRQLLALLVCFIPGALLSMKFIHGEGGTGNIHLGMERYRLDDLLHNNYLVSYTGEEEFWAKAIAILYCIVFIVCMLRRLSMGFKIRQYDGIILTCALSGYVYLFFPDNLLGGGAFSVRAHFILFLYASLCIGLLLPHEKLKTIFGLILFGCFVLLSGIRIPYIFSASRAVADYTSASKHIKPYSVVLPLDFSPNGKDEKGNIIVLRNWVFSHASQYMGIVKPMIILDNYEANTGYFPLMWRPEVNPYIVLGRGGTFENFPPVADLETYKMKSGIKVDYILMWCYDPLWLSNEQFRRFYEEIKNGYNLVYISPTGHTILYEKK